MESGALISIMAYLVIMSCLRQKRKIMVRILIQNPNNYLLWLELSGKTFTHPFTQSTAMSFVMFKNRCVCPSRNKFDMHLTIILKSRSNILCMPFEVGKEDQNPLDFVHVSNKDW